MLLSTWSSTAPSWPSWAPQGVPKGGAQWGPGGIAPAMQKGVWRGLGIAWAMLGWFPGSRGVQEEGSGEGRRGALAAGSQGPVAGATGGGPGQGGWGASRARRRRATLWGPLLGTSQALDVREASHLRCLGATEAERPQRPPQARWRSPQGPRWGGWERDVGPPYQVGWTRNVSVWGEF